jgi:hypothetical protein
VHDTVSVKSHIREDTYQAVSRTAVRLVEKERTDRVILRYVVSRETVSACRLHRILGVGVSALPLLPWHRYLGVAICCVACAVITPYVTLITLQ